LYFLLLQVSQAVPRMALLLSLLTDMGGHWGGFKVVNQKNGAR